MKTLLSLVATVFISGSAFAGSIQFKADVSLERCVADACTTPVLGARTPVTIDFDSSGRGVLTLSAASDGIEFKPTVLVWNSTEDYYDFEVNDAAMYGAQLDMRTLSDFSIDSATNIPFINIYGDSVTQGNVTITPIISIGPGN